MKGKPMKNNLKTTEEIKEALSKVADMMEPEVFTHKSAGNWYPLPYPSFEEIDGFEHFTFENVTPKQAAKAIRNYIEFDDPNWSNAMAALKESE